MNEAFLAGLMIGLAFWPLLWLLVDIAITQLRLRHPGDQRARALVADRERRQ